MEKTYLLALLTFVPGAEGDRATSPLLQVETGRLMLPERCWKRKWDVTSCSWQAKLNTLDRGQNYLLAIFSFVCGAEGDRATSPSSASRNVLIDASRLSVEAQMECDFMQLEGEVGHFAHRKKLPACAFYLFCGVEGDEATSPSFAAENEAIDASSSSLEALIATL